MGRPKGSRNKNTLVMRENVVRAVLGVFQKLGGEQFMLDWAKNEPSEFMRIYAKLIPKEQKVDLEATVKAITVTIK